MISETGYWTQSEGHGGYINSPAVAEFIAFYLGKYKDDRLYDLGCGPGFYLDYLKKQGFTDLFGVEGHPLPNPIFDGTIAICDLAKPATTLLYGNVISLEVGEHIPVQYEQVYLDNITSACGAHLIISWAIPGQGGIGHVNERPNEYIIHEIKKRGFDFRPTPTEEIRKVPENHCSYFRNTLMIFSRIGE